MAQTKVLAGTCRTAWAFVRERWADLLQISAVPLVIVAITVILQMRTLASMMALFASLQGDGHLPPGMIGAIVRSYGVLGLTGLVAGLTFVWLFVRIVRLYALGEKPWLGLSKTTITATLMTLLYAIGIYFITALVHIAAMMVIMLPLALVGALVGDGANAGIAVAVLMVPALLAIAAFVLWVLCRLIVGLPPVALGKVPDFMRDMWKLSAGETWGLPLRLIAVCAVALPVILLVGLVVLWPAVSELIAISRNPPVVFPLEMMQGLISRMMPAQLLLVAVQMPLIWFVVLVLAEANRRFADRRAAVSGR